MYQTMSNRVIIILALLVTASHALGRRDSVASERSAPSEAAGIDLPILTDESVLSDYLEYAALKNPELEAAFNRWKATLERIPQARSLPDPRFTYRYFIREIETRVGPQRQAFDISQTFPWFGKLELAGDVAAEAARAAEQRYEAVKLKLFFEVRDAYYEYYYLTRSVDVTQENVDLLAHLESVARTRYETSVGSHSDVIRAQVELGKLEDRRNALEDLRGPIIARLNAALNRPVESPLPRPRPFEPTAVDVVDSNLLTLLDTANPQLKALDHEVAGYRQAERLAKKQYSPDITLGLSYVDVAASEFGSAFSDNGKDAVGAMLSLNIPLWRGKYSAGVREARLNRIAKRRERTDTTNRLQSQLKMALYQYRDAKRKLDLYGNVLLPKATESLKVTEESFRAGDASFLDLIDAQRTYLDFELANERALANHEQSLARIEMLVGRQLSP